jgi:hypothetical protein
MGAALTYARRYALFALVGIAGEDDLDAPDLHVAEPVDPRGAHAVSRHRPRPNGGDGRLGQKPSAKPRADPAPAPVDSGLRRKLSAVLRDQLLRDVGNLNSAGGAAVWARRILPAKNTLHEADARQVEEAFEAKLTAINGPSNGASVGDGHDVPQAKPTSGEVALARSAVTGQAAEAIDKKRTCPSRVASHQGQRSSQICLDPAVPHLRPHTCRSPSFALRAKPRTWPKGQRRMGRRTLPRPSSRGSSPR